MGVPVDQREGFITLLWAIVTLPYCILVHLLVSHVLCGQLESAYFLQTLKIVES